MSLKIFYLNTPKECAYCHITDERLNILFSQEKFFTKRLSTRGKTLEIDRKDSLKTYTIDNIVWCCYWCNNAKTDEFSPEEFGPVGKHIGSIWEERLKKTF